MAYWAMAFLGSTAVGGPIIGWIGQYFGARWSLGIGGLAAIIASFIGFISIKDMQKRASETIINSAELATNEDRRVM